MVFHGRLGVVLSRFAFALLVAVLVNACGGGGGSSGGSVLGGGGTLLEKPIILFPPAPCVTTEATITVRGMVEDPTGVTGIDVNGVAATSFDGYATWRADVTLAPGDNTITASHLPVAAGSQRDTVDVRLDDPVVFDCEEAAFDATRQRFYHLNRNSGEIMRTDLATGARRIIATVPSTRRIAVSEATGVVYALTAMGSAPRQRALMSVDPDSGTTTTIYQHADGNGPDLVEGADAIGMVINDATQRAIVMIPDVQMALFWIDLTTGMRDFAAKLESGGIYVDFVVNQAGDTAYVMDHTRDGALREIDLTTGNQTDELVIDVTTGDHLAIREDLGSDPVLYYLNFGTLYEYRVASRSYTTVMPFGGPGRNDWAYTSYHNGLRRMWVDAANRRLIAPAMHTPEIVAFQLATLTTEILFEILRIGTGPSAGAQDVGLLGDRHLVFSGSHRLGLYAFDLQTGARDEVFDSDRLLLGGSQNYTRQLVVDGERILFVLQRDGPEYEVVQYDVARDALSFLGPDPDANIDIYDLALDASQDILLATDRGLFGFSRATNMTNEIMPEDSTDVPPFIRLRRIQARPGTTEHYVTSGGVSLGYDPALHLASASPLRRRALTTSSSALSANGASFTAIAGSNTVAYAVSRGEMVRIQEVDGSAVVMTTPAAGQIRPWAPSGMTLSETDVLYEADLTYDGILAIDAITGACVLISR